MEANGGDNRRTATKDDGGQKGSLRGVHQGLEDEGESRLKREEAATSRGFPAKQPLI